MWARFPEPADSLIRAGRSAPWVDRAIRVTWYGVAVARAETTDWFDVLKRLDAGDELAFLELGRLTTYFLRRMRAWDLSDEWPDLLQEVALATLAAFRRGRIREPAAVHGLVAQIARNKLSDRLRQMERRREKLTETLEDPDSEPSGSGFGPISEDDVLDLRAALGRLREPHRSLLVSVYGAQMTYREAARHHDVPLGSAKRYIAQALRELRSALTGGG